MLLDKLKVLMTLGSMLGIAGFISIFFSIYFGTSLADNWLVKQGGADTGMYQIIVAGYINNFLAAGSILFGIGLLVTILSYYKIINSKE